MSKHRCPDESTPVRPICAPSDWPAPSDTVRALGDVPGRSRRARLSTGETAGLLLVALVCAGVVLGLNQLFGRADVFAEELVASASPLDG